VARPEIATARRPDRASRRARRPVVLATQLVLAGLGLCGAPAHAQSNNVRVTGLSDVAFGSITNFGADSVRTENVCAFANTATNGYRITANGSGSGGAFTLASGARTLPYDVQWNQLSGQSSGTQLSPNVALTGQVSTATQQACNSGPASSGSLIVIVRSSAVSSATAGTYSGNLTLLIGPE